MPLFYIHNAGQEPVKPLSRKFRVREIQPTDELAKTQAIHSKKESDFSDVLAETKKNKSEKYSIQQEHPNQQQAAQAYRNTQTENQLNLGQVRDIMSKPVLTIKKNQTLGEAWSMMQKYEIHHLAIIDTDDTLCGMLSEKIILPHLMRAHTDTQIQTENISLDAFCTQPLLATSPETLIKDLVPALLEYGLDGIAVTENGFLSGIATYSDILKVVLKMQAFSVDA